MVDRSAISRAGGRSVAVISAPLFKYNRPGEESGTTVPNEDTNPEGERSEFRMTVTREQAIQDVADALFMEPSQLDTSADLLDQGMDSVRIMGLVERWRSAGVTHIDFIALAEDQRLEQWLEKLASLQRG